MNTLAKIETIPTPNLQRLCLMTMVIAIVLIC